MRTRGAILLIAILGSLLGPAASAEAAPDHTARLAAHLNRDAAFAARVDLDHWELLVEEYKGSGLPGASATVFAISAASAALLGFDPLVQTGWYAAGVDGGAPILVSVAPWKQAWRVRIVLAVDDRSKFDHSVSRIARAIPGLHEVNQRNAKTIAASLGESMVASLAASMRKNHVGAAGVIPLLGAAIAIHRKGDVGIIDILAPYQPPRGMSQANNALHLMDLVRTKPKGLGPRLASGAAQTLRRPGLTLWADGTRAYDQLLRLENLGDLMSQLGPGAPTPTRPSSCGSFREIATKGPFTDVALSMRLRSAIKFRSRTQVDLELSWGLRGPYKLAPAIVLADDDLTTVSELARQGASLAGQTYLRTLAPLRALPRPAAMSGSRRSLRRALLSCGSTAFTTTWVLGWPQLLGHFLDRLAVVHPQAEAIVAGTRNTAFAVFNASIDPSKLMAFGEASVDAKVAPFIESYYDLLFGAKTHHKTARGWTEWSKGPLRPYRWKSAQGRPVFGAGLQPATVPRRMRRPQVPYQKTTRLVAELVLRPRTMLKQLTLTVPWLKIFKPSVDRMSYITGQMQFTRGTFQAVTSFSLQ